MFLDAMCTVRRANSRISTVDRHATTGSSPRGSRASAASAIRARPRLNLPILTDSVVSADCGDLGSVGGLVSSPVAFWLMCCSVVNPNPVSHSEFHLPFERHDRPVTHQMLQSDHAGPFKTQFVLPKSEQGLTLERRLSDHCLRLFANCLVFASGVEQVTNAGS